MTRRAAARQTARKAVAKPARTAGVKRAVKFAGFSIVGTLLANAAAIAATFLMGINAPVEVVSITSLLAGSIAAGVHKSINWVEAGVEPPPAPPPPTLQYPGGGVQ